MLKWRRESVLDIYNLVLALFLFITPWLFAYANVDADRPLGELRLNRRHLACDVRRIFDLGGVVHSPAGNVVGHFPVGNRIHPHTSDALQHWDRRGGGVHSDAGDLVAIRRGE